MATDLERLVVQLSADVKQYNNALNKAFSNTNSTARKIELRFAAMNKKLSSQFASLGGLLGKGLAIAGVGGGISGAQALIDSAIKIQNALNVAGLSGQDLTKVYDELFASAQKNAAPFESLVTLYSRVSSASKELGANSSQVATFTDNVAKALRLTGGSAEESRGALLQLSQAMGGSVIQAQEYNSLIDGLRPLLQAAASGLKEAGGSVGELTQLVKSGKVSNKAFFDAIEAGSSILDDKLSGSVFTISQGFEILQNSLVKAAGKFNDSTEASKHFGSALLAMADFIDQIDFDGFLSKLDEIVNRLQPVADVLNYINSFSEKLREHPLIDLSGSNVDTDPIKTKIADLQKTVKALQEAIAFNTQMGIDTSVVEKQLAGVLAQINAIRASSPGAVQDSSPRAYQMGTPGDPNALAQIPTPGQAAIKQVSLADYPIKPTKTPKSHAPKKTADDRFAEDIQNIKDRTAALAEEQAALGLSFYAQQKRKVSLDLEQTALKQVREEARKKGDKDWQNAQLSPAQVKAIDDVSDAYARQADELRKAQEMYDLQKDVIKSAFDGLRSALEDGKLSWEDFGNIANSILDKIIDKIENDLVDAILQASSAGGGGGGILGGALSWLTGSSGGGSDPGIIGALGLRANGGPVSAGQPYIVGEKRPELFVPNTSGTIVPRVPSITGGGGNAFAPVVTFAPTIQVQGGQGDAGEQVTAALKKFDREFTPKVVKALREAKQRGMVS
ncbi:tape measure protein [Mesorhizobium sp. NZP2298]|uniref:tape measure protein n=1 Tax=Mesorhizobium sp. NZP2298 TaxID=2483403 RepID=UPI001556AFE6|nr:tape measure protein [Mesorhizobium sp. NZP2298]QKC99174.1 hypothetical protein EB231_34865 [Mesorhizobium sp. NZP2298]